MFVAAAGALAWVANAAIIWGAGVPLGHDEAAYAIGARELVGGDLPRWTYRSIGTELLAVPGVLAGGSERALRLVAILAGCLFVLGAWRLARRVAGETTAAWLVAVLAASIPFARRSADLLSDLPAAACLVFALDVIVAELAGNEGPRWRLTVAAVWLAAAFYIRYGSGLPIAVIAVAAVAVTWRNILRRPAPVLATCLVFGALLVPYALLADATTGSPFGLLRDSTQMVAGTPAGLATYVTTEPLAYFGVAATPLLVIGLVAIARVRDRRLVMLWLVGVGDIVALGVTTLAQPRYIFLGLTVLLVVGIAVVDQWLARLQQRRRNRVALGLGIGAAVSWLTVVIALGRYVSVAPARLEAAMIAASAIRHDAAGTPCHVISHRQAQLAWYSGCTSINEPLADDVARGRVYIVIEPGQDDQPDLDYLPGRAVPLWITPGLVRVVRVAPMQ